jgi:hypothetical protein
VRSIANEFSFYQISSRTAFIPANAKGPHRRERLTTRIQRGHLPLPAIDSGVMALDAAMGVEEQTRKLFEVCRRRDVPTITLCQQARPRWPQPVRPADDDRKIARFLGYVPSS